MSSIRITHGPFYADVIHDVRAAGDVWFYVVQRNGSSDILAIGSCASEDAAKHAALKAMRSIRSEGAASSGS